jgi:signal transduction histidine kinase
MEIVVERLLVRELVEETASSARPLIERNGNEFAYHISDDAVEMVGDAVKLRQILLNLLSNAAKFTENGSVWLDVVREAEDVSFSVRDTGIGMSPEVLDTIFESFRQADSSTHRRYGGTGLGLAIAQRQCQMMGGTISVESRVGVGTTFVVSVPAIVSPPAQPG